MSARKASRDTLREAEQPTAAVTVLPARKKSRPPRVRLTHYEIHRGEALRLRIAIAEDALAEAGDELGALIKKISPSTRTRVIAEPVATPTPDFSTQYTEHTDAYHATCREHLVGFFGALCDTSLADALEIARVEYARRAEGGN